MYPNVSKYIKEGMLMLKQIDLRKRAQGLRGLKPQGRAR